MNLNEKEVTRYSEESIRKAVRKWAVDAFKNSEGFLDESDYDNVEHYATDCEDTLMSYLAPDDI